MTVEFFQEVPGRPSGGAPGHHHRLHSRRRGSGDHGQRSGKRGISPSRGFQGNLFSRIVAVGVYPRKTFSIGEAPENATTWRPASSSSNGVRTQRPPYDEGDGGGGRRLQHVLGAGNSPDNDADVEPGPEKPRPLPGGGRSLFFRQRASRRSENPVSPHGYAGQRQQNSTSCSRAQAGTEHVWNRQLPSSSPGKLRRPGARATPQRLRNGQTRAARRQNGPHSPQKRSRAPGALQRGDGSPHHETPHTGHTKGRRAPSPAVPCPKVL